MKALAILLLLAGVVVTLVAALLLFFGFIMSFDAPGSVADPGAWLMRLVFFLPVLLLAGLVFWTFRIYQQGDYTRAAAVGSVFVLLPLAFIVFSVWTSFYTLRELQAEETQRVEDARKYPEQRFVREVPGGADTLIVFPDRMVAFRKYDGLKYPLGGLLGYLNDARTHIRLDAKPDPVIRREELPEFLDAGGRRFSDCYPVLE